MDEQLPHSNRNHNSGCFQLVLIGILLIGICLLIVVPLTSLIQWFVNTQIVQIIGLQYNLDQINLLNDKIVDIVIDIAKIIILAKIVSLSDKMRGA